MLPPIAPVVARCRAAGLSPAGAASSIRRRLQRTDQSGPHFRKPALARRTGVEGISVQARSPHRLGAAAGIRLALFLLLLSTGPQAAPALAAFGFNDVAQRARQLAESAYKAPADTLPAELRQLSYEDYRRIRHKPERALWASAGSAFEVAFFPPGLNYAAPVKINEIDADGVRELRFDPEDFDYGGGPVDAARLGNAQGLGFTGLRVLGGKRSKQGSQRKEALAFHGASLFRSPGDAEQYGTWARALAVDTGLPSGEEFPRFVEFWLERPAAGARELVIYALLDSPRYAGAYRFVLQPDKHGSVQEVRARLYPRAQAGKLGLAPLASMHFAGENRPARGEDYRPEVHDADGLSVLAANGEWIWRPLSNPRRLLITAFGLTDPQGFGLMQRDRDFASYQDIDARRELRPSAWVEPTGAWGPGKVELVQIPTPDEFNNNIVAYWVPEQAPAPGKPYDFGYRLSWRTAGAPHPLKAWVVQTRVGHDRQGADNELWLRVDFADPGYARLPADRPVRAVVSVGDNAELLETRLAANPALEGWRTTLRLRRADAAKPVELRLQLFDPDEHAADRPRSETWSYVLPPE